mmetsp:Transcript_33557/g.76646  ORF Transcript_33557/g.76646 Transcript_33557/m.76646 type:complete len:350 (+) Transcript_33557:58-1107(+)
MSAYLLHLHTAIFYRIIFLTKELLNGHRSRRIDNTPHELRRLGGLGQCDLPGSHVVRQEERPGAVPRVPHAVTDPDVVPVQAEVALAVTVVVHTDAGLEVRLELSLEDVSVANLDHPESLPPVLVPLAAVLVPVPRRVDSVPVPLARGVALAPVLPPPPAPRPRAVPDPPVRRRVRRERAPHQGLLPSLHELLLEDVVDPSLRHVVAEVRHVRVAPARGEGAPSRRAGDDRDRYAPPLPRRVAPDGRRTVLAVVLAGGGVPEGPLRRRHGPACRQGFDAAERRAAQSAVGHEHREDVPGAGRQVLGEGAVPPLLAAGVLGLLAVRRGAPVVLVVLPSPLRDGRTARRRV